jgi:hypothetical protein
VFGFSTEIGFRGSEEKIRDDTLDTPRLCIDNERFSVLSAAARIIFLALRVARREFEYTYWKHFFISNVLREEGDIGNVRRPRLK